MKSISDYIFNIEGGKLKDGELRKCPFCNSSRVQTKDFTTSHEYWKVICLNCLTLGPTANNKEKAELLWNVRMGR